MLSAAVARLRAAQAYVLAPRAEWRVPRTLGRQGSAAARLHAAFLLRCVAPVFDAYVARREWYFAVEWGMSVGCAVVLGALETVAREDADRCGASVAGAAVALAATVVSLLLVTVLRPHSVRLEACSVVVVGMLGAVSSALVLWGAMEAAGVVVSVGAVLELVVMVLLMLSGLEGVVSGRSNAPARELISPYPPNALMPDTPTVGVSLPGTKRRNRARVVELAHGSCLLAMEQSEALAALVGLACANANVSHIR